MRGLKFRVWNNKTNKFNGGFGNSADENLIQTLSCERDSVIEQFTGLKDINGKDIYEGDICNYFDAQTLLIFYDDKKAKFCVKIFTEFLNGIGGIHNYIIKDLSARMPCKIIDNIHEREVRNREHPFYESEGEIRLLKLDETEITK